MQQASHVSAAQSRARTQPGAVGRRQRAPHVDDAHHSGHVAALHDRGVFPTTSQLWPAADRQSTVQTPGLPSGCPFVSVLGTHAPEARPMAWIAFAATALALGCRGAGRRRLVGIESLPCCANNALVQNQTWKSVCVGHLQRADEFLSSKEATPPGMPLPCVHCSAPSPVAGTEARPRHARAGPPLQTKPKHAATVAAAHPDRNPMTRSQMQMRRLAATRFCCNMLPAACPGSDLLTALRNGRSAFPDSHRTPLRASEPPAKN